MKNILLINAEGVQAICLARSLRKQGHRVVGFCNHKMTSGYATRWLSEKHQSPDITLHTVEFKSFLYDYLGLHQVDLIIPLADDGADFLSKNKEIIEEKFHLKCAILSFEVFNIANDKQKLMELCEKYGLCHPHTRGLPVGFRDIQEVADEIRQVVGYVGFPAMIKPNLSQGAKGIMRVDNMKELMEKYPDVHKHFGACTLQQYVEQPDYYYNVMLYRDKKGNMDNYTIIKIRRFFPIKGGSSCYSETVEHEYLLNQCREVLQKLNWVGFADFDVLEEVQTHELKIIEINPRVPSSFQAAFAAGVDFGKVFVADEFNEPMPKFEYKIGKQVRWMGLDVMWFLFSKDRFKFRPSWFNFFGKEVSYHDGAWNDPLPMLAGMFAGILKYLNPSFRKAKLKK
ncbi:ATP-grasp domain-containing protein [uncultured Bacteroides sp.]|uniref:carboxylate--amine ligase n=1 Tax=uncultured Bacteroides sp. TaxID=162156 RepID=UPI00280B6FF2|nr:ATP-grasp domain-containing protein [uncultured Bacteroides sp.]